MSERQDKTAAADIPTALRIDLNTLTGPGPHAVECVLGPEWMSSCLTEMDVRVDEPGAVRVVITEQGDGTVLLRGDLEARYMVPCARCLGDANVEATTDILVTFVPEGREFGFDAHKDDQGEGVRLTAEALDQLTYRGSTLDLADLVSEQLVLAYPIRALCKLGEDCRGLCTQCGYNHNEGDGSSECPQCGHRRIGAVDADPDWKRKLAKLRDKA